MDKVQPKGKTLQRKKLEKRKIHWRWEEERVSELENRSMKLSDPKNIQKEGRLLKKVNTQRELHRPVDSIKQLNIYGTGVLE